MPLNEHKDFERWSTSGRSTISYGATKAIMQQFYAEAVPRAQAWVERNVSSIEWGTPYQPQKAITPTTTSFIMSRGRDYAERRAQELIQDLLRAYVWGMWFQHHRATRSLAEQRRKIEALLDSVLHLQFAYSSAYPPSVPAPTVSTTEDGSLAILTVGTRKVITDDISEN